MQELLNRNQRKGTKHPILSVEYSKIISRNKTTSKKIRPRFPRIAMATFSSYINGSIFIAILSNWNHQNLKY